MSQNILAKDFGTDSTLLPIEQQVLSEYQLLALKLRSLAEELAKMNRYAAELQSSGPSGQADALLTNIRDLERKMGLVYTFFRTAVYSLLLENTEERGGYR
ncbi:hypothetical protein PUMCH_002325 [Australozyma saopauloensis]|uniref:DASH complex subunit DAD3 n=1 Tax=Australozyma saopauloensis TaxID=291208 RepID=A0AAX4H9S3_9ASCO|nr:hypothetical protein PUMCH_002325 [[Candida] saopauloensis]